MCPRLALNSSSSASTSQVEIIGMYYTIPAYFCYLRQSYVTESDPQLLILLPQLPSTVNQDSSIEFLGISTNCIEMWARDEHVTAGRSSHRLCRKKSFPQIARTKIPKA